MAWPSPNPQLFGCCPGVTTTLVSVRSGMVGIMSPPVHDPCSAVVGRDRVAPFTESDVDVVVMTGVVARQALSDQHGIIEIDDLDVAGGRGADRLDERSRRGAVVDRDPVRATPPALALVAPHDPDVDIEAPLVGLMPGHVATVVEADIADGDRTPTSKTHGDGGRTDLSDRRARAPVGRPVADLVAAHPAAEEGRLEMADQVPPRAWIDDAGDRQRRMALERADGGERGAGKRPIHGEARAALVVQLALEDLDGL